MKHGEWFLLLCLPRFLVSMFSQHTSWRKCAIWTSLSEVFLTSFLRFLCRISCSGVAVFSADLFKFPSPPFHLSHMLCVTAIALVTRFSLALWGEAFIVSLLFLNSCAYLWWFCEWCKYLSKKSLCWGANYPLIFSTLKVGTSHLVSKKELAKFGNASEKYCSCSCTCHAEKKIALLSEIQLSLVLVTVVFTTCFSLKDLLTVFWFAAITATNWWWRHEQFKVPLSNPVPSL